LHDASGTQYSFASCDVHTSCSVLEGQMAAEAAERTSASTTIWERDAI
jgi:hypothetical protein